MNTYTITSRSNGMELGFIHAHDLSEAIIQLRHDTPFDIAKVYLTTDTTKDEAAS